MSHNFLAALDLAAAQFTPIAWDRLAPRERSAAVYQALCRLDSGCRRTGGPGDAALPPCRASALHIATRGCIFAGAAARPPARSTHRQGGGHVAALVLAASPPTT